MAQQGIDADDCREFLPDREDELQTAISVLRKKFKQEAQDLKEKQKQARFLAYRGFGADTIQTALIRLNQLMSLLSRFAIDGP